MFKGHPKGLYALALANTGERFGYYTMLAVFALFLIVFGYVYFGIRIIAVYKAGISLARFVDTAFKGSGRVQAFVIDRHRVAFSRHIGVNGIVKRQNSVVVSIIVRLADKAVGDYLFLKCRKRCRSKTDRRCKCAISIISRALCPMVIALEIKIFASVLGKNAFQINEINVSVYLRFHLVEYLALVGKPGAYRCVGNVKRRLRHIDNAYACVGEKACVFGINVCIAFGNIFSEFSAVIATAVENYIIGRNNMEKLSPIFDAGIMPSFMIECRKFMRELTLD